MWWFWVLVGLFVLVAIAVMLRRAKPGPDERALKEHRGSQSGGTDPGSSAGGGFGMTGM